MHKISKMNSNRESLKLITQSEHVKWANQVLEDYVQNKVAIDNTGALATAWGDVQLTPTTTW